MGGAVYNIFYRNWVNCRASVSQIDEAVSKGILTEEQGNQIKDTERDCDTE